MKLALLLAILAVAPLFAETTAPSRTELWVPSEKFSEVLKQHPNGVMLSTAEYEALVRDAGKVKPPQAEGATRVDELVVESMRFQAAPKPEDMAWIISGEVTVKCLGDQWSAATLPLPFKNLTSIELDGITTLTPPGKPGEAPSLLVKGRGEHKLKLEFREPIVRNALFSVQWLQLESVSPPCTFDLWLATGRVLSATLNPALKDNVSTFVLSSKSKDTIDILWHMEGAPINPARSYVDETQLVLTDDSLQLNQTINLLPGADKTMRFQVTPPEAVVEEVTGAEVRQWKQQGQWVDVEVNEDENPRIITAQIRLDHSMIGGMQGGSKVVPLPHLKNDETDLWEKRVQFTSDSQHLAVLEVKGADKVDSGAITWRKSESAPSLVLKWATPQILVDVDTLVKVERDELHLKRMLMVKTDRMVAELPVVLPEGEDFVDTEGNWRRAGQTVIYQWPEGLKPGVEQRMMLRTRKKLPKEGALTVENIVVKDATKLAGYVALDFDPMWRAAVTETTGLEERDARQAPVKGRMAWFALRTFKLGFTATRREPVFDAQVAAYALPRAKTIEIEGQVALRVSEAPLRSLSVKFSPTEAALVRWTSPLVGEQTLDKQTGEWKLVLRKETLGQVVLRFQLSQPAVATAAGSATKLAATLPAISLPQARRFSGTWVVEANTDTELAFTASAMQPTDVLKAPAVEGYSPRHRTVAAYDYGTGASSLKVEAVRHPHSELASMIITGMKLRSVVSPSGGVRHEARLGMKHSGEQFLTLGLPAGAELLSAVVALQPVKPVRGPDGSISLPLPAAESSTENSIPIRLVYEQKAPRWHSKGTQPLAPPKLANDIAVLGTDWEIYAPEGYEIGKVEGQLEDVSDTVVDFLPGGPTDPRALGLSDQAVNIVIAQIQAGTQGKDNETRWASQPGAVRVYGTRNVYSAGTTLYGDLNAPTTRSKMVISGNPAPIDGLIRRELPSAPDAKIKDTLSGIAQRETARRMATLEDADRSIAFGDSAAQLGSFDEAISHYQTALDALPDTTALSDKRKEVERRKAAVERSRQDYFTATTDDTRAKMLTEIPKNWENLAPIAGSSVGGGRMGGILSENALQEIIIPHLKLEKATLEECVAFLNKHSGGVPILLRLGDFPFKGSMSIDLEKVPFMEAVRYVAEFADLRVKWGTNEIILVANTVNIPEQIQTKSGLMSLEIDVLPSGQLRRLVGGRVTEPIELRYVSWERLLAQACGWLLLGGVAFWTLGRRRWFVKSLLVAVLVITGIGLVAETWQSSANAFGLGWLAALLGWGFVRFASWWEAPAKVPALALIALSLLVSLSTSTATEPTKVADPAAHEVFVPYEGSPTGNAKPQRYYLERGVFEKLWSLAKENRKPPLPVVDPKAPGVQITSALHRLVLADEELRVETRLYVFTSEKWSKVELKALAGGHPLTLGSVLVDGKAGELLIEQPGEHQLDIVWHGPPRGTQVDLELPRGVAGLVRIDLGERDGWPTVNPLLQPEWGDRFLTLHLPADGKLSFTRTSKRALNDALPPPAATVSLTMAALGAVTWKAEYRFPGAARTEVGAWIDPAWNIIGVETMEPLLATEWREVEGRKALFFKFTREVTDEVALTLTLEPQTAQAQSQVPQMEPVAGRWEGTGELTWSIENDVKTTGITEAMRLAVTEQSLKWRLAKNQPVSLSVQPMNARATAHVDYLYQVSEQKQEMMVALALKRQLGHWQQLRLTVPDGMELQSVQGRTLVTFFQEGRELYVHLMPTGGAEAKLVVHLARTAPSKVSRWDFSPVAVHGVEKVTNTVLIAAHAATDVKLENFTPDARQHELDPATLKEVFSVLRPIENKRAVEMEGSEWKLAVTLQDLPPRFSADGVMLVRAMPDALTLSQQVLISVEQGALNKVIIKLPATLPEASVSGELLREVQTRVNGAVREYECSFQTQGGLLGWTTLTLDTQLPLTDAEITVPMLEVAGVDRLRRFFVLDNASPREQRVLSAAGADICAQQVLPFVPAVTTKPLYYQGRVGAASDQGLRVSYTQLQATEGNAAVVTLADIKTLMRTDGERWDTVQYSVYNRSLQFLPIILHDKAELIAVAVGGEPVRADEETRNGKRVRLVPLIQTKPGQRSIEVRLIYRIQGNGTLPQPLKLDDPELDGISAERTTWTVSLPTGYEMDNEMTELYGNMEVVTEEGKEVAQTESWLADLSRINRFARGMTMEDDAYQAGRSLVEQLQRKVSALEGKLGKKMYREYDDKSKAQKADQSESELAQLKQELTRQSAMLEDNNRLHEQSGTKVNLPKAESKFEAWKANKTELEKVAASVAPIDGNGLNDNIGVNGRFFDTSHDRVISGNVAGSAMEFFGGIQKSGAGSITLGGGNTYTGGTVLGNSVSNSRGSNAFSNAAVPQQQTQMEGIGGIMPDSVDGLLRKPAARRSLTIPAAPDKFLTAAPAAEPKPATAAVPAPAASPPPVNEADNKPENLQVTQALSQLRPTGRRSLSIDIPTAGNTLHFRKLKDHAVLELALIRPQQATQRQQLWTFLSGLSAVGLLWYLGRRKLPL
jgi:autotransporter-associated beta strand protein